MALSLQWRKVNISVWSVQVLFRSLTMIKQVSQWFNRSRLPIRLLMCASMKLIRTRSWALEETVTSSFGMSVAQLLNRSRQCLHIREKLTASIGIISINVLFLRAQMTKKSKFGMLILCNQKLNLCTISPAMQPSGTLPMSKYLEVAVVIKQSESGISDRIKMWRGLELTIMRFFQWTSISMRISSPHARLITLSKCGTYEAHQSRQLWFWLHTLFLSKRLSSAPIMLIYSRVAPTIWALWYGTVIRSQLSIALTIIQNSLSVLISIYSRKVNLPVSAGTNR